MPNLDLDALSRFADGELGESVNVATPEFRERAVNRFQTGVER
jgi:hypothetical protein